MSPVQGRIYDFSPTMLAHRDNVTCGDETDVRCFLRSPTNCSSARADPSDILELDYWGADKIVNAFNSIFDPYSPYQRLGPNISLAFGELEICKSAYTVYPLLHELWLVAGESTHPDGDLPRFNRPVDDAAWRVFVSFLVRLQVRGGRRLCALC